jgi:ribosomal-protein-alanine N-acetyltransferase
MLRTKCGQTIRLRWMIASDMPEVLEIERASFSHPWGERDFVQACIARDQSIMVAEHDNTVIGFLCYEFGPENFDIVNMAVCPLCRRRGVGRMLVDHLVEKLDGANGRQKLKAAVYEGNTGGQLFFRAMGMRCIAILRGHYEAAGVKGDAYLFTRGKEVAATLPAGLI